MAAFAAVLWTGLPPAPAGAAPAGAAVEIAPHQAIYEMSLGNIKVGADVNDVKGWMLFRWSDACEGWRIEQRYVLEFVYSEGDSVKLSSSYETWEAKDGTAFNFTYKTETNGHLDEDIQGVAFLTGGGESGQARYRLPEKHDESLPAETFFPSAHTLKLIRKAVAGDRFFFAHLFDGTDVDTAVELSAVIGSPLPPGGAEAAEALDRDARSVREVLMGARSWPVRLAFFPVDQQLAEPDYEMSLLMFENGIVDQLVIDYGDFEITGRLAAAQPIGDGGC